MADVVVNKSVPGTPVAVGNGATPAPVAPEKAAKERTQIALSPSPAEFAEIKAAADAIATKLGVAGMPGFEFSIGKFALAHVLRSLRNPGQLK